MLVLALGEQHRLRGGPSLPLTLVAAAQGLCLLRRLQAVRRAPPRGWGGFLGLLGALAWLPFALPLPLLILLRRPRGLRPGDSVCGVLYVVGFWVSHGASTQRALFARDPHDPRLAGLPRVPTATGRVLLAGGWWGLVRRPDHLGELLMALGWSLPCGLSPPLALVPVVVGAALREHRASVAERRCRRELGRGWDLLCRRVPHRLLPHIY
ncbi:delta(14)-sterol reductase TM7SF2-like [Accipiter gentilis]|uniref:delta(14)-sterol reductase TM7SF2-like n=1 Tax=Astur gentilis TaxID=8957 RepID=UPI002110D8F7|nr:delta(14)-sterol reductase TM7SF2-like [Accipiter gentilis]